MTTQTLERGRAGRAALIVLAASCTLLTAGCISIEHQNRYRSLASAEGEEVFAHLVPGQTTQVWVRERLGTPDASWLDPSGNQVVRYDNVRERRTEVALFPLIDIDIDREDVDRYYFEFEGDKLVKYWRQTNDSITPQ